MPEPPVMAELWRGDFLESTHRGHAVIVDPGGDVVEAWGSPGVSIFPRSAMKPLQALALVESGAAARAGLGSRHVALACASHTGAARHSQLVADWLASLDLGEEHLACGPQTPRDKDERQRLRDAGKAPGQCHHNCSGKHSGFLTVAREHGEVDGYLAPEAAGQCAARDAIEEMTGEASPGFGIDGCSAPSFVIGLEGFARGLARMSRPPKGRRGEAAETIVAAMQSHPDLVSGPGHPAEAMMRRATGGAVVKSGAEGVYGAILPDRGLGIALKISDGADRASLVAMAALLTRIGALDPNDPAIAAILRPIEPNAAGLAAAHLQPGPAFG